MKPAKFSKDQVKKLVLSGFGFALLLYVYFAFFLGPLNKSRNKMEAEIKDLQQKIDNSKGEMAKAANLEKQAKDATARFVAFKALSPEGAPIAWFPPRIKTFFANQQIDKAAARLESSAGFKQAELAGWAKYNWLIELPQADFVSLGNAIAELENTEPLLGITKLSIRSVPDKPQLQQVAIAATTVIQKR
jgi:hypothetical protein